MGRLQDFLAGFSGRFAAAFNASADFQENIHGEYALGELIEHLEVSPEGSVDLELAFILRSFGVFRAARNFGADYRDSMQDYVAEHSGKPAAAIFDMMDKAHFGAWKVTKADNRLTASRVDGQASPIRGKLDVFTDHKWNMINRPGLFVGWLLEADDVCMVFFAAEMDALAIDSLQAAAQRTAWGEADSFRPANYEEDVLALLLRPDCLDTQREDGRIFLSPWIKTEWYLRRDQLEKGVGEGLYEYGLDAPEDEYNFDAFDTDYFDYDDEYEDEYEDEYDDYFCESCQEYHGRLRTLPSWSLDAAVLAGEYPDQIIVQLKAFRANSLPGMGWMPEPVGPHSLEYALPIEDMLANIGLGPSGKVDHPKLAQAVRHPIAALQIDADDFRRAGFDLSWSIAQAQAWAKENASVDLRDQFGDAVSNHLRALRWVGIVDLHHQRQAHSAAPIGYSQLMEGIRRLLPAEAQQVPVAELEDAGRGTWTRIDGALRDHGRLSASILRLEHLPAHLDDIAELDGVGKVSCERLVEGLRSFVVGWPESTGHTAISSDAKLSGEAAKELASGLDELGDLF
jgi:hypothetical protein